MTDETGARALGFANVEEAVDAVLTRKWIVDGQHEMSSQAMIIGVVPGSIRKLIAPTLYLVDPTQMRLVSVRLTGATA